MESLIDQPAVQSGLAPFIASLLLAACLLRADSRWQGLAIVGGFLLAVLLIIGPAVTPLTSTRKIVIFSLGFPLLALGLDSSTVRAWVKLAVAISCAVAALLWVLWPVLLRREIGDALLLGGGLVFYVSGVITAFALLSRCCARFAGAAVGVSVATGIAVIVAASALYGQLSFALAAAIGGLMMMRWLRPGLEDREACFGFAGAMAVAVPLALLGAAASVYARLPVVALPLLALSPFMALIPLGAQRPAWLRVGIAGGLALLPAVIAIYLTWQSAGDIGY